MLITFYTPIGIVYQKFNINETDIIYRDLLKYINIHKNELYDELNESEIIFNKVFIKTIINLFHYNQINNNNEKINLDDEILCDSYEFTILFSYEYYIINNDDDYYKKIKNNIKNYNNIEDAINDKPYQIIFIDIDNKKYEEICKLAVQQNSNALQCIKKQTDGICKLAVQKNGYALQYVSPELITDEICKLAVQENSRVLQYVLPELMTDEICKLAVQQNGSSLEYVKQELIDEEMCKLAVKQDWNALYYVKQEFMTPEIFKIAVQQSGYALYYIKKQTDEICKLACIQD